MALFKRTVKHEIHPSVKKALASHVAKLHDAEPEHVSVHHKGVSVAVKSGLATKILHYDYPKGAEYAKALSGNPGKAVKLLPREPSDIGYSDVPLKKRRRKKDEKLKEPNDQLKNLYKPLNEANAVDVFLAYSFIKRLAKPFSETAAFKLGLIDKDGKRLKEPETPEEKAALGYFDKLVFNLKRLLALVPGGKSPLASYAAALLLLRERDERLITDNRYLVEEFRFELMNVDTDDFDLIKEEVAANCTGAGVVGTGDNRSEWRMNLGPKKRGAKKLYGQPIDPRPILRRKRP